MNEMRTKAIHIINELPEPYIVYALEILRNVRQMSDWARRQRKMGFQRICMSGKTAKKSKRPSMPSREHCRTQA